MHLEVLVEDQSGKRALEILLPKIVGEAVTFRVTYYLGKGSVPRNLRSARGAKTEVLLSKLPSLLRAFGRAFASYPPNLKTAVVVLCDLDDDCLKQLSQRMNQVLASCNPAPTACFCFAVEEMEAWWLGDIPAVLTAYPRARKQVLTGYANDSVCGTWETLADAIYRGGSKALKQEGGPEVGRQKSIWAEAIAPHIDIDRNQSPSFQYFCRKLRELARP